MTKKNIGCIDRVLVTKCIAQPGRIPFPVPQGEIEYVLQVRSPSPSLVCSTDPVSTGWQPDRMTSISCSL